MTPENFETIKKTARDVMFGLLETCMDDITEPFVSDGVMENLPEELADDDDIQRCNEDGVDGSVNSKVFEMMVDEMTNIYMKRFK